MRTRRLRRQTRRAMIIEAVGMGRRTVFGLSQLFGMTPAKAAQEVWELVRQGRLVRDGKIYSVGKEVVR